MILVLAVGSSWGQREVRGRVTGLEVLMWTEQFGDTSIRGRQGSGASEVDTVAVMVTYSGDDHVWQTVTGLGLRWWRGGAGQGTERPGSS